MLRKLRQLRSNEKGATAIEFAMVAPVLIWLMFGVIEFGILMATQSALEGAASKAARMYKAQARSNNNGANANAIHNRVARYTRGLVAPGRLRVTARTVTWGNASGLGATPGSNSGRSGGTGDVVQYRVYYNYRVHTPFLSRLIGGGDGMMRLVASSVVQNEPAIGGGNGV